MQSFRVVHLRSLGVLMLVRRSFILLASAGEYAPLWAPWPVLQSKVQSLIKQAKSNKILYPVWDTRRKVPLLWSHQSSLASPSSKLFPCFFLSYILFSFITWMHHNRGEQGVEQDGGLSNRNDNTLIWFSPCVPFLSCFYLKVSWRMDLKKS